MEIRIISVLKCCLVILVLLILFQESRALEIQEIDNLIMNLGSRDIFYAEKSLDELVKRGEQALEKLISNIDNQDRNIASRCIEALGKIGNVRAVDPLLKKLSDLSNQSSSGLFTKRFLRIITIKALGNLKDPKSIHLLNKIKSEGTEYDMAHAVVALSKIGDDPAFTDLIGLLKSDEKNIRFIAAEALGNLQNKEATDALIQALSDKEWFVRDAAAESLGRLEAFQSIPHIESMLDDPVSFVRNTAAEVLNRLTTLDNTGAPE